MQMIVQWPPTYCGRSDVHCKPFISKLRFTIHGLWPGHANGETHTNTCPLPPKSNTVDKVEPKECIGLLLWLVGSTKAYGYMSGRSMGGGMGPTDHRAYTVMGMKTFISAEVLNNKNIKVYISCETVNSSYVFLTHIHFCLDKRLNTFISFPTSTATRGCGTRGNNLVFPTTQFITDQGSSLIGD
ncbi:hypothetical protein KY285_022749 [Solanum tuberosum]|nr:hypothetical protein KY285_022749 [Solanum tuberosum]